jgi:hypothetical protein
MRKSPDAHKGRSADSMAEPPVLPMCRKWISGRPYPWTDRRSFRHAFLDLLRTRFTAVES